MRFKLFIPAHISGFWYVNKADDPLRTGSYGAGLVLEPGLEIEYNGDECVVVYNGLNLDINVYRDAHRIAGVICRSIKINSPYQIGEGYGASAGIALGGLFFSFLKEGKRKTWIEIGKYAHIAEVENITGYGDVITEIYGGGLEIRRRPGAPGIGIVDRVPVSRKIKVLTVSIQKYSTALMFQKFGVNIKRAGVEAYNKFIEEPSIEKFGEVSHEFSLRTGMLDKSLDSSINSMFKDEINRGDILTYFVKKGLLVVICEESGISSIYEKLKKFGNPIIHILNFSGCRFI